MFSSLVKGDKIVVTTLQSQYTGILEKIANNRVFLLSDIGRMEILCDGVKAVRKW